MKMGIKIFLSFIKTQNNLSSSLNCLWLWWLIIFPTNYLTIYLTIHFYIINTWVEARWPANIQTARSDRDPEDRKTLLRRTLLCQESDMDLGWVPIATSERWLVGKRAEKRKLIYPDCETLNYSSTQLWQT